MYLVVFSNFLTISCLISLCEWTNHSVIFFLYLFGPLAGIRPFLHLLGAAWHVSGDFCCIFVVWSVDDKWWLLSPSNCLHFFRICFLFLELDGKRWPCLLKFSWMYHPFLQAGDEPEAWSTDSDTNRNIILCRWWQLKYLLFSPLLGQMIQID